MFFLNEDKNTRIYFDDFTCFELKDWSAKQGHCQHRSCPLLERVTTTVSPLRWAISRKRSPMRRQRCPGATRRSSSAALPERVAIRQWKRTYTEVEIRLTTRCRNIWICLCVAGGSAAISSGDIAITFCNISCASGGRSLWGGGPGPGGTPRARGSGGIGPWPPCAPCIIGLCIGGPPGRRGGPCGIRGRISDGGGRRISGPGPCICGGGPRLIGPGDICIGGGPDGTELEGGTAEAAGSVRPWMSAGVTASKRTKRRSIAWASC